MSSEWIEWARGSAVRECNTERPRKGWMLYRKTRTDVGGVSKDREPQPLKAQLQASRSRSSRRAVSEAYRLVMRLGSDEDQSDAHVRCV